MLPYGDSLAGHVKLFAVIDPHMHDAKPRPTFGSGRESDKIIPMPLGGLKPHWP